MTQCSTALKGLGEVMSGLQCALLQSDGSPAAANLHRELVRCLPLAYIAVQAVLCPWLLLYDCPSSVQRPFVPGLSVILVTWRPHSSDDLQKSMNLPDYKQKVFTIATTNFSVYSQVAQPDRNGNFRWTNGFQLMYLFLLCEAVGLHPVVTKYMKWDSFYSNGSIRRPGLQSEATSGKVDAAVGAIWYRANIVGLSEILAPWGRGCFRYLIPRPKRVNFDWSLFIGVFSGWVWTLIIVFVIVIPIVLTLTTKLSVNPKYQEDNKSLGYTFFFIISVLVQVPQVRLEWRGAQVPILYSWIMATMVLAAAFGGSLSAMLVIPAYEDRPNTLRDLIDRGYTYGSSYSSSGYETIFEDDMSDDWKAWTYGRFRLCENLEKTVENMKTGKFLVSGEVVHDIFFFWSSPIPSEEILEKFEINEHCHQNFLSGPIFPPGSAYSAALNLADSRLQSGGITAAFIRSHLKLDPALRQFIPETDLIPSKDYKNPAKPLSLGSLSSAFVVLATGILLATCLFLVELVLGYG